MVRQSAVVNQKNIWVAAGDGDLDRVKELIEEDGMSPNVPDAHTYTPMHAAASYGHLTMIDYLISRGGNVNVTDEDGETPLFAVESVDVARHLVERGAVADHPNHEGQTAADSLEDDFPEVSFYLRSLNSTSAPPPSASQPAQASQFLTERTTETLTAELVSQVQEIMERAEREGKDPDEELKRVVGDKLMESVRAGQQMSSGDGAATSSRPSPSEDPASKRSRTDGPEGP